MMRKVLARILKWLLLALVGSITFLLAMWFVVLPTGMHYHESHTRDAVLRMVAQELPAGARNKDIAAFMQRHTTRWLVSEFYRGYAGYLPQTGIDKFLFDRKVLVILKTNNDGTLANTEVRFF